MFREAGDARDAPGSQDGPEGRDAGDAPGRPENPW